MEGSEMNDNLAVNFDELALLDVLNTATFAGIRSKRRVTAPASIVEPAASPCLPLDEKDTGELIWNPWWNARTKPDYRMPDVDGF